MQPQLTPSQVENLLDLFKVLLSGLSLAGCARNRERKRKKDTAEQPQASCWLPFCTLSKAAAKPALGYLEGKKETKKIFVLSPLKIVEVILAASTEFRAAFLFRVRWKKRSMWRKKLFVSSFSSYMCPETLIVKLTS